jgi:hypothetical protein
MLKHTYRSRSGSTGVCGVDIYEYFDRLTVMITEFNGHTGVSIATCFAELATDIAVGLMDIGAVDDPRAIAWIEHCEGAPSPAAPWNGETWDEVTMDWDGKRFRTPSWRPCAGDRFKRPALGRSVRPHEIRI